MCISDHMGGPAVGLKLHAWPSVGTGHRGRRSPRWADVAAMGAQGEPFRAGGAVRVQGSGGPYSGHRCIVSVFTE